MKTITKMNKIADELYKIQEYENYGRGIQCIRDLVIYLRKGDYNTACNIARNE